MFLIIQNHYRTKGSFQQGRFAPKIDAAKFAAYRFSPRGQNKHVSKGREIEMCESAFWRGMAAGVVAGAIAGMMAAEKRKAMKTCVGRTMQQMGTAVDGALSDLMHTVR